MSMKIVDIFKDRKGRDPKGGPFNLCICTRMPDGENYFQGIHEVKLPNKFGGYMPMLVNVWTIHFADLVKDAGLFNREQAEFYLEVIAMDGCFIRTWAEENARREGEKN